jgi:hypothetical protein
LLATKTNERLLKFSVLFNHSNFRRLIMKKLFNTIGITSLAVLAAGISSGTALADSGRMLEVTITNITNNQTFTPIVAVSHRRHLDLFELGLPASDELIAIAEGGDIAPITTLLSLNDQVVDIQNSGGLLGPGETVTIMLDANKNTNRISLASMMLPSNDSFIALDSVRVSKHSQSKTYFSPGYDAGSEINDESCLNIPGPYCGGVGPSPADPGEGYVHISRGISGSGDLLSASFDWRNDVAKITVRRVKAKD